MKGNELFIGVDVGSASVRAGVFSRSGQRLAFVVRPIQQFHGGAGVVEQSSADIWRQTCAAVREAVARSDGAAERVVAIGFDATCSLVAVGAGGAPVSVATDGALERDIVMWMDHRAVEEAATINATGDPALAYVGGQVSVEMELPKVLWLRHHFPARYAQVERFFDLADYLVWRSCGADVASVCTLTCKWNYLAHDARFPVAMLDAVGLGDLPAKLPQTVLPLGSSPGTLTRSAALELGLTERTVVSTGIIDAHAGALALIGADPERSLALISGTSNCHMAVSPKAVMVPGVWGPYFGAMLPGLWLSEGGQSAAGALLDWTIRQCEAGKQALEAAAAQQSSVYDVLNEWVLDLQARDARPTRHLHVLPDHHGNRSPRADPNMLGAVIGLSLDDGRDALARLYLATVQALAYGTRHIIETMNAHGHDIDRIVMCGGATKNALLLQEHADVTGMAIHLVEEEDAVAMGAALLAATACGAFPSLAQAARAMVVQGKRFVPRGSERSFHDAKYSVFLQLYDDQRRHRNAMRSAN